jgi:integrase
MLVCRIDYDLVTSFIAGRLNQSAPATVLYEVKLLKRMFKIAQRAKKVNGVPDFPTVSVGDNARKGFCSPEEAERIIEHLPDHAKPVVRTLYLTGWRTGEVLGLTWARVDFEAGTLTLHASNTKSGKPRTFPFRQLPALREVLREQWERTQVLQRERGAVIPHVFHLDGQPLGSFRSAWRDAVRKAGLPGLRPHDMRRSAARNLVRAGVPEGVVMRLCGWTTRHMFDRYNVSDEQDLVDGVGRLNDFLEQRRATASNRRTAER